MRPSPRVPITSAFTSFASQYCSRSCCTSSALRTTASRSLHLSEGTGVGAGREERGDPLATRALPTNRPVASVPVGLGKGEMRHSHRVQSGGPLAKLRGRIFFKKRPRGVPPNHLAWRGTPPPREATGTPENWAGVWVKVRVRFPLTEKISGASPPPRGLGPTPPPEGIFRIKKKPSRGSF